MTKEEQMSMYIKNVRPFLKNRIDNNKIKGLTHKDIDNMDIIFMETEKHGFIAFISEKVTNALSEEIINDIEIIWSTGHLPFNL